jgi:myotubularin-related protein 6/7/8
MIAFCTFKPTLPGSSQASSIRIRGRDFRFVQLNFPDDRQARSAYESIKGATCQLGEIEKLHAFSYKSQPPEKQMNGWELYDAKAEWKRQGISEKGVDRGWRISKINEDYAFSSTYPALLAVPTSVSDATLRHAVKYRSKERLPVLTYLHPVNNCAITRSSQPLSGLRGKRSIQDEKLVAACFSISGQKDEEPPSAPISRGSPASSQADLNSYVEGGEMSDTERVEHELSACETVPSAAIEIISEKPSLIYGAQQHNLIVDARPTVNAYAMKVAGLGSEDMAYYPFAAKEYLGIDNIHVMRDSLNKVIDAIKDADISPLPPNRELLAKSGWLKHITGLLTGASTIARRIGIEHSHVLIHCSDGWDRTSQLSALGQILLDPYYRTMDGFIVLVEKDWLAFGHMFQHRSGFLNSEKWFATEKDALAGSAIQPGGMEEVQNVQNLLSRTQRFFNRNNQNLDNVSNPDIEIAYEESPNGGRPFVGKGSLAEKEATKPKETSPVFHQFLDAVYQLLRQFPTRFEFNERFLRRLLYHLYSCQYGTFLYNSEKDRLNARVKTRTTSVWSYFLSKRSVFGMQPRKLLSAM